jgi:ParB/RepB/Spo0J family partition protein
MPKTTVHKTTFEEIPLGSIRPHPRNARHDLGTPEKQQEMAASIREVGIIEPLVVAAPLKSSWRYTVIAGHRRLNGAIDAQLETVPCIIRHDLDTPEKQLETMLIENGHRKDLTVTEEADGFQALMEFPNYTPTLIAKKLGRTRTYVEGRLTLAHLPEQARNGVDRGQVTISDALELAGFTDLAVVEELAKAIGTRDWSWKLNQAKGDIARAKEAAENPPPKSEEHSDSTGVAETAQENNQPPHVIPEGRTARASLLRTLDTAARCRHDYLAGVITEGDTDIALTIARARVRQAAEAMFYDPAIMTKVLGAGYDRRIRTMTLPQAMIALDVIGGLQRDMDLARSASAWRQSCNKGWLHTLGTVYGYEWSPAELELMGDVS